MASQTAQNEKTPVQINVDIRLSHFRLPPVQSALIVGKKAPIGANAMAKALEEMLPGTFRKLPIEHEIIEAILVREVHLHRIPEERLVPLLVRHAASLMSEDEMIHLDLSIEVIARETLDL